MEKFFERLFDIKRIPAKFLFVVCLSSALILFVPAKFLTKLNLQGFLTDYGKYIGICFIISLCFLIVTFITFLISFFSNRKYVKEVKKNILREITQLDFHEKALLREFFINGKQTLQLPIDNDTVVGLANKKIIYQASNTGFTYLHGAYFPYSITKFVEKNLTPEMVDLPKKLTEKNKERILNDRPSWAKEKSRVENLFERAW